MKIRATRGTVYQQLIISDSNARIESGLLNHKEAEELALQLIDAAGDLLLFCERETSYKLTDIFNELSEKKEGKFNE